jgi:hypothetical protein
MFFVDSFHSEHVARHHAKEDLGPEFASSIERQSLTVQISSVRGYHLMNHAYHLQANKEEQSNKQPQEEIDWNPQPK